MTRYAQMIRLRPEDEQEYRRIHRAVWPGVLETLRTCNIRNYSIFLRNGLLLACFEYHGEDYATDTRRMAECPETQRWWRITDPMQMPLEDAAEGEKWSSLEEVFYFGGSPTDTSGQT